MYHFHRRTAEPLGPASAPGYDKSTSRCQTLPSIRALGEYQPVIPGVPLIRCAKTRPHGISGSLKPTFVSARPVCLAVRQTSTFTLFSGCPTHLSLPLYNSGTLSESAAPAKLRTTQCPLWKGEETQIARVVSQGWFLPPILYTHIFFPVQGYSQGAQGLTVYLRVLRIFTENSISLSPLWRQRGDHETIHARRNLPDKEFRYLRTVRVTAAVYWAFHSMPRHVLVSFQHRAGLRPYTSVCTLAESCVFSKQLPPPFHCDLFRGVHSPEVTGRVCRVPSKWVSHSPSCIARVHLCRFAVRCSLFWETRRDFSWRLFQDFPYPIREKKERKLSSSPSEFHQRDACATV